MNEEFEWKFNSLSYKRNKSNHFFLWSLFTGNVMIYFLSLFTMLISNILRIWFLHFQDTIGSFISFPLTHISCVICSHSHTPPNTIKCQKTNYLRTLKWYFQDTMCILNISWFFSKFFFAFYNVNLKANWKYSLKAIYSFILMLMQ